MSDSNSFDQLLHELAETRGLDLRAYKLSTVERRIQRRMQQIHISDVGSYRKYLDKNPDEVNEILKMVLINVTQFFRDPPAWEIIQHSVLPMLLQDLRPGDSFRAWSAGCASGEEPFSLAILMAEHFGSSLRDYDVKIYATDKDEDALNVARRGVYGASALRHISPEWQQTYFSGVGEKRLNRDIRRLVIFGRSDVASDAPISHVRLLICRNVLIYFGLPAQRQILRRFQYAVDPGGVLFLGKSETQLKSAIERFKPLHSRWRIFQRMDSNGDESKPARYTKDPNEETLVAKTEQELQLLTLVHNSLLQVLEPGIIILDGKRTIITENESVARMWGLTKRLTGQQFEESELAQRCPDLKQQLDASVEQNAAPARFKFQSTPEIVIAITIRPIRSESGVGRVGTLIYFEDVTPREVLQGTIEALQTTTEELQSANEELETTNEELQSTNEELETTNEELQSSNEELETTNEELQSLNEELETTNEELAVRTREVDEMNVRYKEMLERMPWPVLLVSPDLRIYVWSSAAQGLLGFAIPSEKGMAILELPISMDLKELLIRRHQSVLKSNEPSVIRNQSLAVGREFAQFDIHVSPLSADDLEHGVLLMFERLREVSKEAPKKKLQASLASKKKISLKKAARKKKKS